MANGLLPADFLLPTGEDMTTWSVIACDQFTSDSGYWARIEEKVGNNPSTLRTILPEVYLESNNVSKRISHLKAAMNDYLDAGMFRNCSGYVYVERRLNNNTLRRGIVGLIDLEDYSFEPGATSPIRATEQTVIERIPPRLNIRKGAPLEFSHVMMLFNDPNDTVTPPIELRKDSFELLYDFELMENGGHICGWLLDNEEEKRVRGAFEALSENSPMLFAVGDGNHSLAAAKSSYELLKKTMPAEEYLIHPARYALVEAVNLFEPSMQFEAIHRIVYDVDTNDLLSSLKDFLEKLPVDSDPVHKFSFQYVTEDKCKTITADSSQYSLPVAALQRFLDDYISRADGKIDYIHGESVLKSLASKPHSIGFLLPPIDKSTLFSDVLQNGTFPRKTFSCGAAEDKRYYLECRNIL